MRTQTLKKSEKAMIKTLVRLLNQYRGVKVNDVEVESASEVKIHFQCRFKRSLAMICGATTDTISSIWCHPVEPDFTKVDHVLFVMPCEKDETIVLLANLEDGINYNPELNKDYVLRN